MEHLAFIGVQTILSALLMRTFYINPNQTGYECALSLSCLSHYVTFATQLVFDVCIFATIEKFMKENWVIRDSMEKSFKQLLTMIDDQPTGVAVLDQTMNIKFFNRSFGESIHEMQKDKMPLNGKDLIHSDDREMFKNKVNQSIKNQKSYNF